MTNNHRYLYDGDNRLTQVETSLDGYHWTLEASYFYYAHGPLARIETGQHNIQGTDYFYTLQGWIKGVNSIGLTHTRQDPGRDGYTGYTEEEAQNPTFNRDEYAYALNYYEGDYEARGENHLLGKAFHANEIYSNFKNYEDKVGGVTYNRESLYNGNIAAMATSIRHFGELQSTQSMNYRYDQLHRIAAAHASKWEGIWTTVEGSYNTSYAYDGNGNIQNLYRNNLEATTIDELYYHYDPVKKNRLDVVKDGGTAEGLNNANPYEYKYDQIGNLTQNLEDGIADIEWNIYGKVEKVTKTPDPFGIQVTVEYRYDGTGNRIMKKVSAGATSTTTTYLRDASGNVMAIYEEKTDQTLAIKEIPIYGSSRLGQYRPKTDAKKTALGQRIYEFSNHLGNVLVTLTDNKVPQTDGTYESVVVSASDYYPFGMAMGERTYSNSEYRYGFNGQEQSDELDEIGNSYTAEFWQYDARIGRRWNVDPIDKPWESSYAAFSSNPIIFTDINGDNADFFKNEKGNEVVWRDSEDDYLILDDGEKYKNIGKTHTQYNVDDEGNTYAIHNIEEVNENGSKYIETHIYNEPHQGTNGLMAYAGDKVLPSRNFLWDILGNRKFQTASISGDREVDFEGKIIPIEAIKVYGGSPPDFIGGKGGFKFLKNIKWGKGLGKLFSKNKAIKTAINEVFENPKRLQHFIHGSKNSVHQWETLIPDLNPNEISKIVEKVLKNGSKVPYKSGYSKVMSITKNGVTKQVEIPYFIDASGKLRFSSGWVL